MKSKHLNILLVEDNAVDALFIERLLNGSRLASFTVTRTESLAKAIAHIENDPPQLILLDLQLVDEQGLSTLERIRKVTDDIPVIVTSGNDDEATAVQAVKTGAQDYLVKGRLESGLLVRAVLHAAERAEARAKLLRAEETYRGIYENAVVGIFQTTSDGHYLSANPALARIYGYESPEELLRQVSDIGRMLYLHEERRAEFVRIMQEHGIVSSFESQIRRKNGEVIWIAENVRAVLDKQGRIKFYEGTVEDVNERHRAEAKLAQSEALYHSLVDAIEQAIFRKDLQGRFTFGNQRFCETLDRTLDEIVGKTDADFFAPEMVAKYQADDRGVTTTGRIFETIEQYRPPTQPGVVRYVHVLKTPLRNPTGEIIGLQGLFWDITEKKEAEERERIATEALARSREELSKKNEAMEEDLKMANEIQLAMLPQTFPVFPPHADPAHSLLKFHRHYTPTGAVGGDFFSIFPLSDRVAGLFICDVMGHGVRAALVTAMVRALVEELRPSATDPAALLIRLNGDLRNILKQTGSPLFTTAFYAVADLDRNVLLHSNAGHPSPFLVNRADQTAERLRSTDGKRRPALGLFADADYRTFEQPLRPGDMLLAFTDGVFEVEGPDEQQFSQDMLLDIVRKNAASGIQGLIESVLREIRAFTAQESFSDDICLVGLEVAEDAK
jgi:sigma-B regulation protein RsbU (phosphoserine phosphatase)